MKHEDLNQCLQGADAQLNRAIEGLMNLNSRHGEYALALDQAAGQLLRLKSALSENPHDRQSMLASLHALSSKTARAEHLLHSAAALYLGQAGSRAKTEVGYHADGNLDCAVTGASVRLEA